MLQTIFAAQIQEAIDVPFPGPLLGCWTRESLRTTSHAKDGSPSLSGLTAFFDLAWYDGAFCTRGGDRLQGPAGRWLADLNTVAGRRTIRRRAYSTGPRGPLCPPAWPPR